MSYRDVKWIKLAQDMFQWWSGLHESREFLD